MGRANIILVGMMGSGKSTLGRQIARRLHRPFFDSDAEIEHRTGVSIPIIFDHEGEAGFRLREAGVIEELSAKHGSVLATGGGAILLEQNRRALRSSGVVIYLHASIQVLRQRTGLSKNRPLLNVADRAAKLIELYAARDPLYRETAHLVVESDQSKCSVLLGKVLRAIQASEFGNEILPDSK